MNVKKKISLINYTDKNDPKRVLYLVIHYVGGQSSAKNNASYFYDVYRGASAHYFVDQSEIWQCVADEDIAWHVGGKKYVHLKCRNSNAIGIEMCCKKNQDSSWSFEEKTVANTVALASMLMKKYNITPDRLLRHYDVTGKLCPAPYIDDEVWKKFKADVVRGSTLENGTVTEAESIKILKEQVGLAQATITYLLAYTHGKELIAKLAKGVKTHTNGMEGLEAETLAWIEKYEFAPQLIEKLKNAIK